MSPESKPSATSPSASRIEPARQAQIFNPEVVEIRVTVEKFRVFESGSPSSATLELVSPSTIVTLEQIPGSHYIIKIAAWDPETEAREVILRFLMDRTEYLLIGVAFSNSRFSSTAKSSRLGQEQFPTIELATDTNDRVMSVMHVRPAGRMIHDMRLLIQEVGTDNLAHIRDAVENED